MRISTQITNLIKNLKFPFIFKIHSSLKQISFNFSDKKKDSKRDLSNLITKQNKSKKRTWNSSAKSVKEQSTNK